ncbi:hypothetical protein GALL_223350 [mine drainage metagenome]|uniref:Uncharacterized protein n=1 Tax=mine drainage metagenome TaxID=410659 RepID=A0A1J5S1L4_9ZZZZ
MNARAYLTILRPLRTVLFIGLYGFVVLLDASGLVHGPLRLACFVTFALVGPLVVGSFLLGPLHEVMHTTVAGVLPGLHRTAARWHLAALVFALLGLVSAAVATVPGVPWQADAGLIAAGLALPLCNRRQDLFPGVRAGVLVLILLSVLLGFLGSSFRWLSVREPWLVFLAGFVVAAYCVRRGFDRRGVRARARGDRAVVCTQSVLFTGGAIMRARQREFARRSWARIPVSEQRWDQGWVDGSFRSRLAIVHRVSFPSRIQFLKTNAIIQGLFPLILMAGACAAAVGANGGHLAGLGGQLAETCALGFGAGRPVTVFLGVPLAYGALASMVLTSIFAFRRLLPVPLARSRMASVMANYTQTYGLAVLAGASSVMTMLLFVALDLLGEPLRWFDLKLPLACLAALIPAVLLSWGLEAFAWDRISIVVGGLLSLFCPLLAATAASFFVGPLLSLPGAVVWLTTTLACWRFHRWAVRRSYLTSDLLGSMLNAKELFWGSRN